MPAKRISPGWVVIWLLFYGALLPFALPRCLHWLSSSSNRLLGWGALGSLLLAAGVALSLYQAGRRLMHYFSSRSSTPPFHD
ncbi:hypothetical protein LGH70_21065 [Hymenobacter sp. BT635]|uniref:Uncharacterized protein n=1 Tax=Hymenobacter nitidus TaxID=2880929 RepID=A0ABS8AJ47_9BACT|nr:hypothetical protein [Hymenobacter nitidus]MCB2380099.1 hypothetical protein [Hymenobacter nitidus]